MKKSYLLLADGFEEIEALGTLDILRRAGMDVLTVSINPSFQVTGAHGLTVQADLLLEEDMSTPLWIILPGGLPGAQNLADDYRVRRMLTKHNDTDGYIAAICAAPALVLAPLGILNGLDATCYPGFEDKCPDARISSDTVVVLDRIITAAGPGCTFDFALAIAAKTMGADTARQVREGMLLG